VKASIAVESCSLGNEVGVDVADGVARIPSSIFIRKSTCPACHMTVLDFALCVIGFLAFEKVDLYSLAEALHHGPGYQDAGGATCLTEVEETVIVNLGKDVAGKLLGKTEESRRGWVNGSRHIDLYTKI